MARPRPRPQKGARTSRPRATIEAATSAARARNEAAALIKTTVIPGEVIIAIYEDALLSKIYADSNINPLSASLVMQRSDVGEDTCRLDGYARGSQLPRASSIERIPQRLIDESNATFTKFALSTFIPSQGRHVRIEAYTYGQLVEFLCAAVEVRTATVSQHPDGETKIQCVIEDADVLDSRFEQVQDTQDELDYITLQRTQAEATRARAEADAAEAAKNRQKLTEMSEVSIHLESVKKKPIPHVEKRFTARGIAVFATIKSLTEVLSEEKNRSGRLEESAHGENDEKFKIDVKPRKVMLKVRPR
ncbi:hypothetical protein AC579_8190 [Pseudocercospora musae]|uniref:Uncharacterized protein n=1 Tax=Pseudocercospora musae TaxID=113226 RepID=A0A139IUQ6_9PEZI|nr:hypothetical protein AC579_8190 [Pseudocercospora musae]